MKQSFRRSILRGACIVGVFVAWATMPGQESLQKLGGRNLRELVSRGITHAGSGNSAANLAPPLLSGRSLHLPKAGAASTIQLTEFDRIPTVYGSLQTGKMMHLGADARPVSLASADFDEDGVPDLITGFAVGMGGAVVLQGGNADSVFPHTVAADLHRQQAMENAGTTQDDQSSWPSPFSPTGRFTPVDQTPEFLAAGDFNADGHPDLVLAARDARSLTLLLGDGQGHLAPAPPIRLPGRLTTLAAGEINRADGLADVAVGIEGPEGSQVLVYEGPRGAFSDAPETFDLPGRAVSLLMGRLDGDELADLAVGANRELLVIQGRDRCLSLDADSRAKVPAAEISRLPLMFEIMGMAVGSFTENTGRELALLADDGSVHVVSPQIAATPREERAAAAVRTLSRPSNPPATLLVAARVSGGGLDDLILADRATQRLQVVMADADSTVTTSRLLSARAQAARAERRVVALELSGVPTAALPLRLNADALSDLVILRSGQMEPAVLTTEAALTFTVTNTSDSGPGSLREAIQGANANLGTDLITFNISGPAPYSISLASGLPPITDPVTIDATTQPGYSGFPIVELNGGNVWAQGLEITGGSSTIRGLVVHGFQYNGIRIWQIGGNIIEGNFVGTNAAGTAAASASCGWGNCQAGIYIGLVGVPMSPANTIGGTTAAARNLVSGNGQQGIDDLSGGALIQGNYIGTDISGATAVGNNFSGINVIGPGTMIGGTTHPAGNLVSGNGMGIAIYSSSGMATLVQGNYIGTDWTGTQSLGNAGNGVSLNPGSAGNIIGGTAVGSGNLISGNNQNGIGTADAGSNQILGNLIGTDVSGTLGLGNWNDGIQLNGSSTSTIIRNNVASGNRRWGIEVGAGANGTQIQGNLVGTNQSGSAMLGNGAVNPAPNTTTGGGLAIYSAGNVVGGPTAGQRNILSGNGTITNVPVAGLLLIGASAQGNQVLGNYIGTNASGTAPLRNNGHGILMTPGASNNIIGGSSQSDGNLISGNGLNGVTILSAQGNVIQGNFIGTNASGSGPLGNNLHGVVMNTGASNNFIGGSGAGAGNLISGNSQLGVIIYSPSQGNVIQGNFIGTDATGTSPLGNATAGVFVAGNNNTVGGASAGEGNRIAYNGTTAANNPAGVIVSTNANGNLIRGNSIFSHLGLGIDLQPNGITPNDIDDGDPGSNNQQNFPLLSAASDTGSQTLVQGTLNSTPGGTFTLEFFANSTCDASGYGEGSRPLGTIQLTTVVTGGTNNPFSATLARAVAGEYITATATDSINNTSEFSQCRLVSAYTPTGSNIPVSPTPDGAVNITFAGVTSGGATTAAPIDPATAGTLPGGFVLPLGGAAYEIATTALVLPPIDVCLTVPTVSDPGLFNSLRILHNEGGTLVDRTILPPDAPAPNFATRTLCARVFSLSPFVVARSRTPRITWNNPAAISYRTPLSGTQLDATASVPGAFAFTPPAGTFLNVGDNQLLSVLFTPTDSVNFDTASKTVTIKVTKATTVTGVAATPNPAEFGQIVNLTATVLLVPASAVAVTGSVQFFVDGLAMGGPVPLIGGIASATTSALDIGSRVIAATYAGGVNFNTSTGSVGVTILGAQGIKTNVLGQLRSLRASVTDKQDLGKLDDAIDRLTTALSPNLWIDQNHVDPKTGDRVFADEKDAVVKLGDLIKGKKSAIPDSLLLDFISRLVKADRILAQTIISDAIQAGSDPSKVSKAQEEMAKADRDVAEGNYASGIEQYRNAWQQALNAMKR